MTLSTMDWSQDQWRIADYYSQEAVRLRQKAQGFCTRGRSFMNLCSGQSEEVAGTRVLSEDAASEQNRLDKQHNIPVDEVPWRLSELDAVKNRHLVTIGKKRPWAYRRAHPGAKRASGPPPVTGRHNRNGDSRPWKSNNRNACDDGNF